MKMNETFAIGNIKLERLRGTKYVVVIRRFWFYSKVLKQWCCIPKEFIHDEESIPLLKGSNPEAGAIHDYLCRYDSVPVVSKHTAAKVYKEFQDYYNAMDGKRFDGVWDWIKSKVKTEVVLIAPFYFHKHRVMATLKELMNGKD